MSPFVIYKDDEVTESATSFDWMTLQEHQTLILKAANLTTVNSLEHWYGIRFCWNRINCHFLHSKVRKSVDVIC